MNEPWTSWHACASIALTLMLLAVLCGCGSPAPLPLPVPPLPLEARQPQGTAIPSVCSQGCSKGLTQLRQSWLISPTDPAPPALPASAPSMR